MSRSNGRFQPKYGAEVDKAIKLAVAQGVQTSKILAGLRAGTLDGLKGPVALSQTTFCERLARARERGKTSPAKSPSRVWLERTAAETAKAKRLIEGGADHEELKAQTWLSPSELRYLLGESWTSGGGLTSEQASKVRALAEKPTAVISEQTGVDADEIDYELRRGRCAERPISINEMPRQAAA
jgi:hypothetical protein